MFPPAAGIVNWKRRSTVRIHCRRQPAAPCAVTIERLIESPMPMPPALVVKNVSKSLSLFCGLMPVPLSRTMTSTPDGSCEVCSGRDRQPARNCHCHRTHRFDAVHNQVFAAPAALARYPRQLRQQLAAKLSLQRHLVVRPVPASPTSRFPSRMRSLWISHRYFLRRRFLYESPDLLIRPSSV